MDRPLLLLEHLQSVYETYLQIKDQALVNTFLWLVPLFLRHMLACPAFFPSSEMVSEIGRSVSDHLADRRLTPPKPSSARPHLPEPSIGFFPSS